MSFEKRGSAENMARILALVCRGEATSRAAIARRLGVARSTIGLSVDYLLGRAVLAEVEVEQRDGRQGRPVKSLTTGPAAPSVGIVNFRQAGTQVGIADLSGAVRAVETIDLKLAEGPEPSIDAAIGVLRSLADREERVLGPIGQIVVGVPVPVSFSEGSPARSAFPQRGRYSIVAWQEFPVAKRFRQAFDVPALLDNDANLLALGDAHQVGRDAWPLVRLHLSQGFGAGIVTESGTLFRGAAGSAGDIGHVAPYSSNTRVCWCGKTGCIATQGNLQSVLDDLGISERLEDDAKAGIRELRSRLRVGEPEATQRLWSAADAIGEVAAIIVDVLNPGTLVLGGDMMHLGVDVIARVRSVVYERALSLSTRRLQISMSDCEEDGAVLGGARLGSDLLLTPESADRFLRSS